MADAAADAEQQVGRLCQKRLPVELLVLDHKVSHHHANFPKNGMSRQDIFYVCEKTLTEVKELLVIQTSVYSAAQSRQPSAGSSAPRNQLNVGWDSPKLVVTDEAGGTFTFTLQWLSLTLSSS